VVPPPVLVVVKFAGCCAEQQCMPQANTGFATPVTLGELLHSLHRGVSCYIFSSILGGRICCLTELQYHVHSVAAVRASDASCAVVSSLIAVTLCLFHGPNITLWVLPQHL
jgi:hypothetical protein